MKDRDEFVFGDPNFHDGRLLGMAIKQGTLRLLCSTVDDSIFEIALEGVVDLRAENFREGNIIFDVFAYPEAACPPEVLRFLDEPGPPESSGDRPRPSSVANARTVLHLVPSWGCQLVAISTGSLRVVRQTDL